MAWRTYSLPEVSVSTTNVDLVICRWFSLPLRQRWNIMLNQTWKKRGSFSAKHAHSGMLHHFIILDCCTSLTRSKERQKTKKMCGRLQKDFNKPLTLWVCIAPLCNGMPFFTPSFILQGHAGAFYQLGLLHRKREGVEDPSDETAFTLIRSLHLQFLRSTFFCTHTSFQTLFFSVFLLCQRSCSSRRPPCDVFVAKTAISANSQAAPLDCACKAITQIPLGIFWKSPRGQSPRA